MKRFRVALLGVAVLFGLMAGVAAAKTFSYTQKDSGKSVSVKKGDILRVTLGGASASTGYSWNQAAKPAAKVLKLTGKRVKQVNCAPHVIGCPESTTFTYKAIGTGKARLSLVLLPPGGVKPARSWTLKVTVK